MNKWKEHYENIEFYFKQVNNIFDTNRYIYIKKCINTLKI